MTYTNLLCLSEVILRIRIQSHLPKRSDWDDFLRDKFSIVQNVEAKRQLLILIEDLNTELNNLSATRQARIHYVGNIPPTPDIRLHQ